MDSFSLRHVNANSVLYLKYLGAVDEQETDSQKILERFFCHTLLDAITDFEKFVFLDKFN